MAVRTLVTKVRAGDTEPLIIDLDPDDDAGFDDLSELSSAVLYARLDGADANHVDGAACSVSDSANKLLSFDPVGNGPSGDDAFDTGDEGTYYCYVRVTWSDGDITRHPPSNDGTLRLDVVANYEA